MSDLQERRCKSRFIARLAGLLVLDGIGVDAADAYAVDCYSRRYTGVPEEEAASLHQELKTEATD